MSAVPVESAAPPWWELNGLWAKWVAFLDQEEHPRALGLVRVLLGVVICFDLAQIANLDLVLELFGTAEMGGLSDAAVRSEIPYWYRVFPNEAWAAWALYLTMLTTATTLTLGFFTRSSALILLLCWSQQALILPPSDRGIDLMCRNILCLLMFTQAGQWLGADGAIRKWRTGVPTTRIPAWPRYLLLLQIVVMYWTAGVQKVGLEWTPMGQFAAVYVILQDPAIATYDFAYVRNQPFYFSTQIGTAVTYIWQWTYPIVLLWYWYDFGPQRDTWFRRVSRRFHLKWVYIAIGAWFHLMLAVTMELGIFPYAMLALYPAFFHPDTLLALGRRLGIAPVTPAPG